MRILAVCRFSPASFVLFAAFSLHAAEPLAGRQPAASQASPKRVLVRFQPGVSAASRRISHQIAGGAPVRRIEALDISVVSLPANANPAAAVQAYLHNPLVEHAEVDARRYLDLVPDDPLYDNPPQDPRAQVGPRDHQRWTWNGVGSDPNVDAEAAWDRTTGRSDVVVAVVDSGVDLDHPDLAGNIWTNLGEKPGNRRDDDGNGYVDDVNGYDFDDDDPNPDPTGDADGIDNNGNGYIDENVFHGTCVASLVAGRGNDGSGLAGAAWNVKIMPLRIFDDEGGAFLSEIVEAVVYAADNGADVANYSFTSSWPSSFEQDAINYAHALGVVQVGSAGNGNSSSRRYPAAYDHVIAVGACDHGSDFVTDLEGTPQDIDGRAPFSEYGTRAVDVVAPGRYLLASILPSPGRPSEDVFYVSIPEGSGIRGLVSGTSFSAPIVSGLAALLISRDLDLDGVRDLTNDDIEAHIQTHTVDLPDDPDDVPDGGRDWDANGRVSFRLALDALGGSTNASPSVTITSPEDGSCVPGGDIGVTLTAVADDTEDGDLSANVEWSSSLEGYLGTGASLTVTLSDGAHLITASVTDSAGKSTTDQIALDVGPVPPVADAGSDQTAVDADGDGVERMTLDGSGSSDSCGGSVDAYEWYEGPDFIASGVTPMVDFAVGTHTVTLVVTDNDGGTASDDVVVTVEPQATDPTQVFAECITYETSGGRHKDRNLHITILVVDDFGSPVNGAAVSIIVLRDSELWSTGDGVTGPTGQVIFTARKAANACYMTGVFSIVAGNLAWDGITPDNWFCKGTDPSPAGFCHP